MKQKVITDNNTEQIVIKWDGERFAIVGEYKRRDEIPLKRMVLILSPKEMLEIIKFASSLGEELQNER